MFEITIIPSVLVLSGLAVFILVQYRRHRWLNDHPIDTWQGETMGA